MRALPDCTWFDIWRRNDFTRGQDVLAGLPRGRVLVRHERRALRRARVGAAVAVAEADRQPELPGEVRAQEVRQVGAVGRRGDGRLVLRIVLAQAEEAVEEVARRIAQRLVQRPEVERLVDGRVEEPLDPRRVEILHAPIPGVARLPDALGGRGVLGAGACATTSTSRQATT